MSSVTLDQLTKHYDGTPAVRGITLTIEDGEFFSLLGPSGCGKTTILRMIAGFVFPTSGAILFDNREMTNVPPNRRNTGMVFQNYALFPHMTVFENVEFGLRTRRIPRVEIADRVAVALDLVGLAGLEKRPVPHLSGGQQQRVALARAVVIEPALLLLDEPLSNLDAKLREETRDQIRELQQKLGITTIYVTHDQEEALAVSDRIAVLHDGLCEQFGFPDEIYNRPANLFVTQFMGKVNLWEGTLSREEGRPVFRHTAGLTVPLPESVAVPGGRVYLAVRPQSIRLTPDGPGHGASGTVRDRRFKGASVEYHITVQGLEMIVIEHARRSGTLRQPGETVSVHIPGDQAIVLTE